MRHAPTTRPLWPALVATLLPVISVIVATANPAHAQGEPTPRTHRGFAHATAVAGHVRLPYSADATDTWDALTAIDADPATPGHILTIYGNASFRGGTCSGTPSPSCPEPVEWNREHLWPVSFGLDRDGDRNSCNFAFTDLHHLRPSEEGLNSSRGNKPFDRCTGNCEVRANGNRTDVGADKTGHGSESADENLTNR